MKLKLYFTDERHEKAFRELRAKLHDPNHEYWLPVIYIASSSEALQQKMMPYINFEERAYFGHDMMDTVEFTEEESLLATLSINLFNNSKKFELSLLAKLGPKGLVPVALSAIALRHQLAEL